MFVGVSQFLCPSFLISCEEFCILQLRLSGDITVSVPGQFRAGEFGEENSERKIRSGEFGADCFDLCRMHATLTICISGVWLLFYDKSNV